jgi:hypothetical protein
MATIRTRPTSIAALSASGSCSYSTRASLEMWLVAPVASATRPRSERWSAYVVRLKDMAYAKIVLVGEPGLLLDVPLGLYDPSLALSGD